MYINLKSDMRRLINRFNRSESGIAALEFALIFPVFISLLYIAAEFTNYTMHKRRAQMSIDFAVEYISRDDDANMTAVERMNSLDMWNIIHPTANGGYDGDETLRQTAGFSRSYAGIEFVPMPVGCALEDCVFEPDVEWTFSWAGESGTDNPIRIACNLEVVENNAKLNGSNIQRGMAGRSGAIMGVYVVRYKPLLNSNFFDEHDFQVSTIRQSRGSSVPAHPRNQGGTQC